MAERVPAGLRTVALLEAAKGALVLLAGFGLLALLHRDAQALGDAVVERFHLNPAHHAPQIFLALMGKVTDGRLWALAVCAAVYASVRLAEAWGLWRAKIWAEWFGILSGALYIPWEVYGLLERATAVRAALLLINAGVVLYLARVRWAAARRGRGANPPG